MQKSNLQLINPIFFAEPMPKSHNWCIKDLNNSTIGISHRSKEEKTKLKFIKDKSKEILALTIEWSYEEVHNKYA